MAGWGKGGGKGGGWGGDSWGGDWTSMMGDPWGMGGGSWGKGGGGGKGDVIGKPWGGIQENQGMCSIHHKLRKMQYLEDKGGGRFVCVADSQCKSAGPPTCKKTMCKFFLANACNKGALCAFAHSEEEIGQPIPEEAAQQMEESLKAKQNSLPGWTEEPPAKAMCSIHNKMRSVTCLQATDDGSGTFFCKPGSECKGSGEGGGGSGKGKGGKGKGWDKGGWDKGGWDKGGWGKGGDMWMMMKGGGYGDDWWGGGGGGKGRSAPY